MRRWRRWFGVGLLLLPTLSAAAAPLWQWQSDVVIPATTVMDVKIGELSGIAWDADEQLLYAVSDRGAVFHFQLTWDGNRISAAEPVYAANLLDSKGQRVRKGRRDSEGLAVLNANNGKVGDSQLLISFEGEPRIIRFSPAGRAIKNMELPRQLGDVRQLRKPNDGLESVAFHSRYGLLTAPESPLKGKPRTLHTLYGLSKSWSFNAYPAENSSITALETLPDGNMLVLERAWSGFPNPLVVSLRYLDFKQCPKKGACPIHDIQVFSSLLALDNFEGLTHVDGNRYLMISDDGGGDWQRTLLTAFTLE
ncbi:esterase-like activity of phytase family protein [Thiothrix sp.]|uniref:esterase-like activity of phytase family protein n=1 Tax=Thiothrix sp. TaxID=1032 RepID=UPI00257B1132|nr:esterase-like activity of phytase family protein [Thiothrix sp.]